nr:capsid protein [Porcine astrovirus 4]
MANDKPNVQSKVVTTTTTATRRRGGRRRRRTPRPSPSNTTTVRRVTTTRQTGRVNRRRRNRFGNPGRASLGGIRQRITATLGTVGSNQGPNIELEMAALLNPALMKESTGSNVYGPLQIYASTYSLWKLDYIKLTLTPLVGQNAVSGTAVRASFNASGQPGTPNWSSLGARKHKDTNPGRPLTFYLSGSDIKGPKEGWFYCNTKNDPKMCIAGTIEIHTMGKTVSSYKNEPFNAPLFLAELTGQWSFKNYNPQPGMLNLVKTTIEEQPQTVKIHSKPGDPILISVPEGSSMARIAGATDNSAGATASEIIWQICDSAIDIASGAFPPPFGWLFKSGWWFVKRIANRKQSGTAVGEPDPGEVTFQVYQSISDAQNDVPCIATGTAATVNATINDLEMMQITPGNVGQQQESIAGLRRTVEPTLDPITIISSSLLGQAPLYGSLHPTEPLNAITMQGLGGWAQKIHTFSIHELNKPVFLQGDNEVDPQSLQINTYPIYKKTSSTYDVIGKVHAASYARTGRQPLNWTTCLWRATQTTTFTIQGTSSNTQFLFVRPNIQPNPVNLPNFTYVVQATNAKNIAQTQISIQEGNWYLSVFASWGGAKKYDIYGVEFWAGDQTVNPSQTYEVDPTFDAYKVGIILGTAQPLQLQLPVQPTALTTSEILALRDIVSGQYHPFPTLPPPPPSEYDNLEVPPLEDEEEEEQGATGGHAPLERASQQRVRGPNAVGEMSLEKTLDTKNWVEFGHIKRPPTPFSPIEEEDEEDEDSDLDDDDYAEPPSAIKNLLTPEAKDLYGHLRQKGFSHEQATNAAQAAFPHFALEAWDAAYHNAMADGLSPPTARDLAWAAVSDFLS